VRLIILVCTVFSLSCSGVGFQSPPFHGFVNDFLQIWLVKNGSVPADVTVTLSNDDKSE